MKKIILIALFIVILFAGFNSYAQNYIGVIDSFTVGGIFRIDTVTTFNGDRVLFLSPIDAESLFVDYIEADLAVYTTAYFDTIGVDSTDTLIVNAMLGAYRIRGVGDYANYPLTNLYLESNAYIIKTIDSSNVQIFIGEDLGFYSTSDNWTIVKIREFLAGYVPTGRNAKMLDMLYYASGVNIPPDTIMGDLYGIYVDVGAVFPDAYVKEAWGAYFLAQENAAHVGRAIGIEANAIGADTNIAIKGVSSGGANDYALYLGDGNTGRGHAFIEGAIKFEVHAPTGKDSSGGLYLDSASSVLVWVDGSGDFYTFPMSVYGTNAISDSIQLAERDTIQLAERDTIIAGVIIIDDSTIYVDAVNNRVGIGTTNPLSELEVQHAAPNFALMETDAGANAKYWDFTINSEQLLGYAWNDAHTGGTSWIVVDRTGSIIDSVTFRYGDLILGSVNIVDSLIRIISDSIAVVDSSWLLITVGEIVGVKDSSGSSVWHLDISQIMAEDYSKNFYGIVANMDLGGKQMLDNKAFVSMTISAQGQSGTNNVVTEKVGVRGWTQTTSTDSTITAIGGKFFTSVTGTTTDTSIGIRAYAKDGIHRSYAGYFGDGSAGDGNILVEDTLWLGSANITDLISDSTALMLLRAAFVDSMEAWGLFDLGDSLNFGSDDFIKLKNGSVIVDDSTFYLNALTNRIGILTKNPYTELGIQSTSPSITLMESDGVANNKHWDFTADGEQFAGRAVNDVYGGWNNWITVDRANHFITSVAFGDYDSTLFIDFDNDRVGIRTKSPQEALDVGGGFNGHFNGTFADTVRIEISDSTQDAPRDTVRLQDADASDITKLYFEETDSSLFWNGGRGAIELAGGIKDINLYFPDVAIYDSVGLLSEGKPFFRNKVTITPHFFRDTDTLFTYDYITAPDSANPQYMSAYINWDVPADYQSFNTISFHGYKQTSAVIDIIVYKLALGVKQDSLDAGSQNLGIPKISNISLSSTELLALRNFNLNATNQLLFQFTFAVTNSATGSIGMERLRIIYNRK